MIQKMLNTKGKGIAFVLAGLFIGLSGCAPVAGGVLYSVGTYAFIAGSVARVYEAPVGEVFEANIAALEKMGVTVTETLQEEEKSVIRAESFYAGKIYIELKPVGEEMTEVRVRIGPFGNEKQERMVHEALAEELAGEIEHRQTRTERAETFLQEMDFAETEEEYAEDQAEFERRGGSGEPYAEEGSAWPPEDEQGSY